jgi:hypothetical protein
VYELLFGGVRGLEPVQSDAMLARTLAAPTIEGTDLLPPAGLLGTPDPDDLDLSGLDLADDDLTYDDVGYEEFDEDFLDDVVIPTAPTDLQVDTTNSIVTDDVWPAGAQSHTVARDWPLDDGGTW